VASTVTGRVDDGAPPPLRRAPARDGDDRSPRLLPVAVLLLAVAFTSSAATFWWSERSSDPGAADIGFYDDMTAHHVQALEMARIYLRGGDDAVLQHIAWEIAFTQSGDIRMMQQALTDWGEPGSADVAMDWMGMPVAPDAQPGMAAENEMAELERARGRDLDDLFTRLMIDHHAGGVHMASAAADMARLGEVRTLARAMAAGQRAEIGELNSIRQRLGLPRHEPAL